MWKANWGETKKHFTDWWNHDGLVVGMWGAPLAEGHPHEEVPVPDKPQSIRDAYTDGTLRARRGK